MLPGKFGAWDFDQDERRGEDFESNLRLQLTDTELFAKLSEAVVPESFDVAPDTIAGWSGGVIFWIERLMPTICSVMRC